jgi:trehalose-6-phosphatase
MVWEITPELGWDKGSALRLMVQAFGQPALIVYAGDGANDLAAYEAVQALGGISIGVGASAPSTAHWRLRDPEELASFLEGLAAALLGTVAARRARSLARKAAKATPCP